MRDEVSFDEVMERITKFQALLCAWESAATDKAIFLLSENFPSTK